MPYISYWKRLPSLARETQAASVFLNGSAIAVYLRILWCAGTGDRRHIYSPLSTTTYYKRLAWYRNKNRIWFTERDNSFFNTPARSFWCQRHCWLEKGYLWRSWKNFHTGSFLVGRFCWWLSGTNSHPLAIHVEAEQLRGPAPYHLCCLWKLWASGKKMTLRQPGNTCCF